MDINLNINFNDLQDGLPKRTDQKYYGERYSIDVIAANITTCQVYDVPLCWDFEDEGWVHSSMDNGPDPENYKLPVITHFAPWPRLKVI